MARYHHGNLAHALIDAAVRVIEEEGVYALSLRKAARAAGVSHAAPAHHFGDLRGLLAGVARRGYEGLLREMQRPIEGARALDRLRQIGQGYVTFASERAGLFRAMFHPQLARASSPDDAHRQAADATFRYLRGVIEDCQREGSVRPGDARRLAVFAWSTVHGAAALLVDDALPLDAAAVVEAITRDLYLGLRPLAEG